MLRNWFRLARFSYRLDRAYGWTRWQAFWRCLNPHEERRTYPPGRDDF